MKLPKKVLILGSGALKIGQAGEFDYSGSQAIKALKEEGVKTVLVNPNIATIQTDKGFADEVYFLPVNPNFVEEIIKKERPEGILLGFGGQTALNCGLELEERGIFKKYDVAVLGTPIEAIRKTESRQLFSENLLNLKLKIARSQVADSLQKALTVARRIGFPVICRNGFSLGGQGSSVVGNERELKAAVERALAFGREILIEECLYGWKEIEYEVVRDKDDNCIVVCNMENMDPMGVHTGESIVVSPSQTLNNEEYFQLRAIAQKVIRHFGVIGECNIQFALNPKNGDYRIIEVNARLSRSSALASKVTGYPLAFVAAKLSLGYRLDELKNNVTLKTSALFEPALDYLAVKIPRWDFEKFGLDYQVIGTEMQSVGEVMAIGRNFPEAIQKATRMLGQGFEGVLDLDMDKEEKELKHLVKTPNSRRLFYIAQALLKGISPLEVIELAKIDPWFIAEIGKIVEHAQKLAKAKKITSKLLWQSKSLGFSDRQLAKLIKTKTEAVRKRRLKEGILPAVKQIDTLAAEYPAQTNYLYLTYAGSKDDLTFTDEKQIMVLASGPYCIGSSVEFGWCAVSAVAALRRAGRKTILVNCNPETVSTDYDVTDKLYFEEISLESVLNVAEKEKLAGVMISVGGQIANTLAMELHQNGLNVLGTKAENIDRAEDRKKFSELLTGLKTDQPVWEKLGGVAQALEFAKKIGYPVIARPSYVLSGKAMEVFFNQQDLKEYLSKNSRKGKTIVISKFVENASEIEADLVAKDGKILICAISEHIENAGVHSGDASIVFPVQKTSYEAVKKIKRACQLISKALCITGPANIQFLAKDNQILVIECNLRASRTFPFISKMCNLNFIEVAAEAMLGLNPKAKGVFQDASFVGVKVPQFSFSRLRGVDPVLRVEMASTGEVACLGDCLEEGYLKSILATNHYLPQKAVLISLGGDENKVHFLPEAKAISRMGLKIYATDKTALFLIKHGLPAEKVFKIHEEKEPNIFSLLSKKKVDLVVNLTDRAYQPKNLDEDDYQIRRAAVDFGIFLVTNLQSARLLIQSMAAVKSGGLKALSYQEYLANKNG